MRVGTWEGGNLSGRRDFQWVALDESAGAHQRGLDVGLGGQGSFAGGGWNVHSSRALILELPGPGQRPAAGHSSGAVE